MKLSLFNKNPEKKATKFEEKANKCIINDDLDGAVSYYEKAGKIYEDLKMYTKAAHEYFEAARCAISLNDEEMAGKFKIQVARVFMKGNFSQETSNMFNEASDHFLRAGRYKESARALGMAIISAIMATDYDHAIALLKKGKRKGSKSKKLSHPILTLADMLTRIICNGEDIDKDTFEKAVSKASFNEDEKAFVSPVIEGARLSHNTFVTIEPISKLNKVTTGKKLKFKIKINSPVPSQVIWFSIPFSNNIILTKDFDFSNKPVTEEEVQFEIQATLSGTATLGPLKLILQSEHAILHKITSPLEFEIAPSTPKIRIEVNNTELSTSPGTEFEINVKLKNMRSESIDNIYLESEYPEAASLSIGTNKKTIGLLPGNSEMNFPFYFTISEPGDHIILFKAYTKDGKKKTLDKVAIKVRVG